MSCSIRNHYSVCLVRSGFKKEKIRRAEDQVTGGRWRRIELGDVLAEYVVKLEVGHVSGRP